MNVGSLCTGYAGLDLALTAVLPDAELAWYSEIDKHASGLLAERYPHVANLGDLKRIDWGAVPRVDCLTAGYPCQPFSHAGKRQGADDPRHLWPYINDAVRVLRPRLVVLENVAGHLSLGFDTVLGDLAALGFDAEWGTLRASDVGACHGRNRLFVIAADARSPGAGRDSRSSPGTEEPARRWASDKADAPVVGGQAPAADSRRQRHGGGARP